MVSFYKNKIHFKIFNYHIIICKMVRNCDIKCQNIYLIQTIYMYIYFAIKIKHSYFKISIIRVILIGQTGHPLQGFCTKMGNLLSFAQNWLFPSPRLSTTPPPLLFNAWSLPFCCCFTKYKFTSILKRNQTKKQCPHPIIHISEYIFFVQLVIVVYVHSILR